MGRKKKHFSRRKAHKFWGRASQGWLGHLHPQSWAKAHKAEGYQDAGSSLLPQTLDWGDPKEPVVSGEKAIATVVIVSQVLSVAQEVQAVMGRAGEGGL